jgi:hypothetical protein
MPAHAPEGLAFSFAYLLHVAAVRPHFWARAGPAIFRNGSTLLVAVLAESCRSASENWIGHSVLHYASLSLVSQPLEPSREPLLGTHGIRTQIGKLGK